MSTKHYYFWRIYHAIRNFYYNIKYRCQRFLRGYADEDLFSIDYWFADIMPKMLTEFKKNLHSYPAHLNRSTYESYLDEMIMNLHIMQNEDDSHTEDEMLAAKHEFFKRFEELFYDLWD